ncbi:MAG: MotA/TolQ/ExbB proton channel family protein [Parachlamydia sp.]|nr:MotA/TolQ/ExbB proton channel family protein [Parachlamydia sp.]
MNVNLFLSKPLFLTANPFIEAYIHSDFMGKLIFIGLVLLSVSSWIVLIYKVWLTYQARRNSLRFQESFQEKRQTPLNLSPDESQTPNPFRDLYRILKQQTVEILNKNRLFGSKEETYLSPSDIDLVQSHLMSGISNQVKNLEKYLFILSTVVSLGPFLGLLGTVWGILTTFSEMQNAVGGSTNQMVIGGLSLALATTVLGLVDAIPALIGYNYLKTTIRDLETDMEGFSTDILASVELQYRQVDIRQ